MQLAAENVGLKAAFSPEEIPAEAVDAFKDTCLLYTSHSLLPDLESFTLIGTR